MAGNLGVIPTPGTYSFASFSDELDLNSPSRHPRYFTFSSRLQSFSSVWIKHQTPASMAEAGFYFTERSDCVQCFHCGMCLGNWDPYDDPWIEHARWAPDCEYVIAIKGSEFTQDVQDAIIDEDIEIDGTPAESESAETAISHATGLSSVAVRTPYQDERYSEDALKENPLLTAAAQSVLEMGYLPKTVKIAVDLVLQRLGWEELTADNVMTVVMEMEDNGTLPKETKMSEKSLLLESSASNGISALLEEVEENRQKTQCKVCCDAAVSIIFLPCRHLVSCAQCSPALKTCPLCRNPIEGTIRARFDESDQ